MHDVARVLVLHTGGTIGMREGPRGFAPVPGALEEEVARRPMLCDPSEPRFTTARFEDGTRIRYDVVDYDPLLDSANLELSHWARFAADIGARYDDYDGFVVLHGTDTMAYTASALSFLLEGLAKPVVLTGSQIPLSRVRSDGMDNLLTALWIAARSRLPEVMLAFHHKVFRGNRATKVDATELDAFASPNLPPLAEAGIALRVRRELALPMPTTPFRVDPSLSPHVAALRLYPGITESILENFLRPPLEGLVLETYGTGNAPERRALLDVIEAATRRGVIVLNVTQCLHGTVSASYQAGRALADAGVLPGGDLTPEAALTKLCWLLGKRELSRDEVRRRLVTPLRGEMSDERA
ncbi:type I asparaginase [Sandaracinus amylolyticus]|uniref:type I asparaginase n=1 Tax=Sandaracinus amylolyticus TaxID=927083 RepID=UPI001F017F9E|nr:type I asparaginase [Sandaracinus amylolyticus]UJR82126.1 L-asparaginase/archaeal Glu-tRNAGln amidotransferase subunit D [Sandaracinus amylolyticus]